MSFGEVCDSGCVGGMDGWQYSLYLVYLGIATCFSSWLGKLLRLSSSTSVPNLLGLGGCYEEGIMILEAEIGNNQSPMARSSISFNHVNSKEA